MPAVKRQIRPVKRRNSLREATLKSLIRLCLHTERLSEEEVTRIIDKINCRPATGTIFEIIQDIININGLTKFYEEWTLHVTLRVKNAPPPGGHASIIKWKTTPPPGGHVLQANGTIFKLCSDDRTIDVTSRVLTR
ncbi:hypothetical protein DPMN_044200 [Dreissena polymorpha]|uniref:Uncharacterized protein n=1 Tax=Dreissena polymorpha TaxID=45954 RepID=A0A9D4D3R4_DREPO|nr:hypothetical protein DPMN_044200 [Dreissena polymorpha]